MVLEAGQGVPSIAAKPIMTMSWGSAIAIFVVRNPGARFVALPFLFA